MLEEKRVRFSIGQVVHHKMFDYRGVVVDVDLVFNNTNEWYDKVALSRPPKNKPWYHVLVDKAVHVTYVTERNLEPDETAKPIDHPFLSVFFADFKDGCYVTKRMVS